MASEFHSPIDRLWQEYAMAFQEFDDLSLARWMAQTLGQLEGRAWRLSHPLVGAYRLAAQIAHDRQIWLKRIISAPRAYSDAECCRAPLLPLLTRDVVESGLICQHCGATAIEFDAIHPDLQQSLRSWSDDYSPIHAVAHWDERQQDSVDDYEDALDEAADAAEKLLIRAGRDIIPCFLDHFPAAVWEDQDECLEVRPEDIPLK